MLRSSLFLVLISFVLYSLDGFSSIGRIGNKIGDPKETFMAQIPEGFDSLRPVPSGGLVLESGLFASDAAIPVDVVMLPFRNKFPELVGVSRSDIERFFLQGDGPTYTSVNVRNGAMSFLNVNSDSISAISVCGDGRGYVMMAIKVPEAQRAINKLLATTTFEKACEK